MFQKVGHFTNTNADLEQIKVLEVWILHSHVSMKNPRVSVSDTQIHEAN